MQPPETSLNNNSRYCPISSAMTFQSGLDVNYKFQRAMGESPVIEERQYSPEPELPSKKPTQAHHLSPQVYAEPSRDSLINLSRSLTITSNAVHPADGGLIDDFQGDLFNTLEHDNLLISMSSLSDGSCFAFNNLDLLETDYSDVGALFTMA
ncbi:hypothetical protein NXS19_006129 [Fusarium pseudograminearum]|nr:hypothetical protein NXS19_006129 [Fusarium pseudograminearum]